MRAAITGSASRLLGTFRDFTAGQKLVAVVGTTALLLGAFVVFRWVSAPSYTPLFSGLAPTDASAVIDQLESSGVPYQLADGGGTIMVPRDSVYQTRIALSGEGLPGDSSSGYSILDGQGLSTSQFKEQTDFKRAMEGELAKTIEALDSVDTAVVHLAIPAKEVFSDSQDPTTASVLIKTRAGSTLTPGQVQAVVNLVASSIDGLSPDNVSVADSTGAVLSAPGNSAAASATTQTQQVEDFQDRMRNQVQTMLDRVLGVGNSAAEVTAVLSFDKKVTRTTRYFDNPIAASSSESTETYTGAQADQAGGVVGTVPQTGATASPGSATGSSQYSKTSRTADNALNQTVEEREAAPGGVESLHVGVVLDQSRLNGVDPLEVQALVSSALGIDAKRGDTVQVSALPFDRTVEEANAKELEAAASAEQRAGLMSLGRNIGLGILLAVLLLAAWVRSRRNAAAREAEGSRSWVDQLRLEGEGAPEPVAVGAGAGAAGNPAVVALEASDAQRTAEIREDIADMVGRQPEDVAALLRNWLAEKP